MPAQRTYAIKASKINTLNTILNLRRPHLNMLNRHLIFPAYLSVCRRDKSADKAQGERQSSRKAPFSLIKFVRRTIFLSKICGYIIF